MFVLRAVLVTSALVTIAAGAMARDAGNPEQAVCGALKERFAFWVWSRAAGKPDAHAADRFPNADPVTYKTADGRLLKGYRLRSTAGDGVVRGSVLVAQGNAMLADQLLSSLDIFAQAGFDTWIFDYRGYGKSEGVRRLKAIVSDYRALSDHVRGSTRGPHRLYGISFGGVVLLNVVGSGAVFDRIVIDSSPARIAFLGCPESYDPAAHFPLDASRFLIIAGERDTVVRAEDSRELVELARTRGGRAEVRADFAHPFMDPDSRVHRERLELIRSFLVAGGPVGLR